MILMVVIVVSAYSVLAVCTMIMTFLALYGKLLLGLFGAITLALYVIGFIMIHWLLHVVPRPEERATTKGKMLYFLGAILRVLRIVCVALAFVGLIALLVSWFIL